MSTLTPIETLVAPITDSNHGVGEDLTFDLRLDAIVAARQADDPLLAQGNWVTELKVADWDFVKSQCATLLTSASKDMKVALWYVNALSHTDHLAGINHGLQLLTALIENYWLTMYPPLDGEEDSMDIRAGLLSWFVKILSDDLKQLPLADSQHGHYNYNHFVTTRDHDKQRLKNSDNDIAGDFTLNDYNQAIKNSSESWQHSLTRELAIMNRQWQALTDQLNDLMGMDAPVFAPVTELLTTLTGHLKPLIPEYSDNLDANEVINSDEPQSLDVDNVTANTIAMQGTSISTTNFSPKSGDHQNNRKQALKLLAQIQEYFATNEPHSPVTALLGRAIDWADMPLDQWLAHIIKDDNQLATLSDMIGIKPKRETSDEDSY